MKTPPRFRHPSRSTPPRRPQRIHTALSTCTLALLATLTACSRPDTPTPPDGPPPVPVHAITVNPGTHHASEEVVGSVRAKLHASLEARISGRIERVHATLGQAVRAGDPLLELEARELEARLGQAIALYHQAEQDLQRYSALLDQEAVTRAEFDAFQARYSVAKATWTEATSMLEHARIVAPFDGVVTRKLADVGDLAQPGRPLLELEDPRHLRFEAHVPESLFEQIQPNAQLPVRVPAIRMELTGTVTEITPVADPFSRTSLVKLDLPTSPGLRGGQFGRVRIPTTDRAALRVPSTAVVRRGQLELVFVIQNDRAHLRLVRTGKRWDDETELVSGLQPGETIVATGADSLRDGQPVTVTP